MKLVAPKGDVWHICAGAFNPGALLQQQQERWWSSAFPLCKFSLVPIGSHWIPVFGLMGAWNAWLSHPQAIIVPGVVFVCMLTKWCRFHFSYHPWKALKEGSSESSLAFSWSINPLTAITVKNEIAMLMSMWDNCKLCIIAVPFLWHVTKSSWQQCISDQLESLLPTHWKTTSLNCAKYTLQISDYKCNTTWKPLHLLV